MGKLTNILIFNFFVLMIFTGKVQAQLNADSLIHLINTSSDPEILVNAYNDYGAQLYRSKTDSAIYYGEKALSLAEHEHLDTEIFAAYNLLGLAYQTKGIYNLSLEYFNKALKYEPDAILKKAKTYHNIALTYLILEDNTNALQNEMQAIEISQLSNDSVLIGVIYQSMCNIYRDMHEYDKAEKYIEKSIEIFNNISNTGIDNRLSMLANAYSSYGNLLLMDNRVEEAIEKHKLGLQIHNLSGDLYNKAIILENLGDDYKRLKNYSESLKNYNAAKDIMQQLHSETDVGYELLNIANVYKETGNYPEALNNLDSALHIFERNGADAYRSDVYYNQYLVYEKINNPSAALSSYKKYNHLKDSLDTETQKSELLRLKEEFEVTQKEQQIILLETENALKDKEKQTQIVLKNIAWILIVILIVFGILIFNRNRIKQQLKQLEIRNSIASDLHDDIGSTLSSIKMYSDIVSGQIKNSNPESIPLLQQMSNNSKEMIENMSDIVWAIKPSNDAFKNIESRMFNFATELCNAGNIELIFKRNATLDDLKIPMDQRRDLYLIFKEAVNNAIKYAACTKLEIIFFKSGASFNMQVGDNGKGFDVETMQVDENESTGNGLKNMNKRALSHNGTLKIDSKRGSGTTITFIMPIP